MMRLVGIVLCAGQSRIEVDIFAHCINSTHTTEQFQLAMAVTTRCVGSQDERENVGASHIIILCQEIVE